jgi:hypothetical protein
MSTDGKLIRLILKDAYSECGEVIHATNYPDLFVHFLVDGHTTSFTRPIHPGEVNVIIYVNNRDDYLYHHILQVVREEFNAVLKNECQVQKSRNRVVFQRPLTDAGEFQLYTLGNGTFAVDAGEVSYSFRCTSVVVKAHELKECYMALPVLLPGAEGEDSKQLFMEPISRRLSKYGMVVPCHPSFQPKYMNVRQEWVLASPGLHITAAPKDQDAEKQRYFDPKMSGKDFSKGGIYSEDDLVAFQNYLDYGRMRASLIWTLSNQHGTYSEADMRIKMNNLFPLDTPISIFPGFLGSLLHAMHVYGEFCSVLVGTYLMVTFGIAVMKFLMRFRLIHAIYGWTFRAVRHAMFPTNYMLTKHRTAYRQADDDDEPEYVPMEHMQRNIHRGQQSRRTASMDRNRKRHRPSFLSSANHTTTSTLPQGAHPTIPDRTYVNPNPLAGSRPPSYRSPPRSEPRTYPNLDGEEANLNPPGEDGRDEHDDPDNIRRG